MQVQRVGIMNQYSINKNQQSVAKNQTAFGMKFETSNYNDIYGAILKAIEGTPQYNKTITERTLKNGVSMMTAYIYKGKRHLLDSKIIIKGRETANPIVIIKSYVRGRVLDRVERIKFNLLSEFDGISYQNNERILGKSRFMLKKDESGHRKTVSTYLDGYRFKR